MGSLWPDVGMVRREVDFGAGFVQLDSASIIGFGCGHLGSEVAQEALLASLIDPCFPLAVRPAANACQSI